MALTFLIGVMVYAVALSNYNTKNPSAALNMKLGDPL